MDDETKLRALNFVRDRINAFEMKHGVLNAQARECLEALLYATIRTDPKDLKEHLSPEHYEKIPRTPDRCFCERKS